MRDGANWNGALRLICDVMLAADRRTEPAGFRATALIGWTERDRNWSWRSRNIPLPPHPPDEWGTCCKSIYELETKPDQVREARGKLAQQLHKKGGPAPAPG